MAQPKDTVTVVADAQSWRAFVTAARLSGFTLNTYSEVYADKSRKRKPLTKRSSLNG